MAGRPPKPTNLKILEGNRGRRPLPQNEPKPEPLAPDMPDWLHADAKAEWQRIVPQLTKLGLLAKTDLGVIVGYCESWAQYKKAMEFLHKHGEVYPIKNDDGTVKYLQQVPQVSIANKAWLNICRASAMMGLSASDRARLEIPGAKDAENRKSLLSR